MISREELRQLAEITAKDHDAITFYYQPATPQDRSHRHEIIQIKELVRDALKRASQEGNDRSVSDDLQRILGMADEFHGNGQRGRAIFACKSQKQWREFDIPTGITDTHIHCNTSFHLLPVAGFSGAMPVCCVLLLDRVTARIFKLANDRLVQADKLETEITHRGKSDGWGGFDGGHAERHVENEVRQFFKSVGEHLKNFYTRGEFEKLIVGCRDETWPMIEDVLHTYLKQEFIGRFTVDPGLAKLEEVKEQATRILEEHRMSEYQGLVRDVIGEARRNGLGVQGLSGVVGALERGEVHKLVISPRFRAGGAECTNCRHIDANMTENCAVCGQKNQQLEDIIPAVVGAALRQSADIVTIDDAALDDGGHIAALLRFRGDQNTAEKLAS